MDAILLDNEFMEYLIKLSQPEKKSLLFVAKNFVELKEEAESISIEQYNKEIDDAMTRMDNGGFYTHDKQFNWLY
jgi:hypothetical protein